MILPTPCSAADRAPPWDPATMQPVCATRAGNHSKTQWLATAAHGCHCHQSYHACLVLLHVGIHRSVPAVKDLSADGPVGVLHTPKIPPPCSALGCRAPQPRGIANTRLACAPRDQEKLRACSQTPITVTDAGQPNGAMTKCFWEWHSRVQQAPNTAYCHNYAMCLPPAPFNAACTRMLHTPPTAQFTSACPAALYVLD